MKEYFYFYKPWYRKCKGSMVIVDLVNANAHKQMNPKEGFLFIDLMKRKRNRNRKRNVYEYERSKK